MCPYQEKVAVAGRNTGSDEEGGDQKIHCFQIYLFRDNWLFHRINHFYPVDPHQFLTQG